MSVKRIIPCLDIKDGRVVKGVGFEGLVEVGDVLRMASGYDREGADELVMLDIASSPEGRDRFIELLRRVAGRVSMPVAAGGGVASAVDVGRLLDAGASKVSICSAAVRRPEILSEAASEYGQRRVVLAIDAGRRVDRWEVFACGGGRPTGLDPVAWARRAVSLGAGEILLTSIDRDGRQDGYALELTRAVAEAVPVPVVASGGAGSADDVVRVLTDGRADAALLASLLHFRRTTVARLKAAIARAGLETPGPRPAS